MGNDVSKEIKDIVNELEVEGKSFMTPKSKKTQCAYIDPRSPTEGIVRTPIEVRKVVKQSEEICSLRRRWKSEPELTPVKKDLSCKEPYYILWDDPRSPSLGITRTPIQVVCDKSKCGEIHRSDGNLHSAVLQNASNILDVPDCRSPSLGICRTPIQVAATVENGNNKKSHSVEPAVILLDRKPNTPLMATWHTPVSKKLANPSFVYVDEDNIEIRGKTDIKQYEQNSVHEKENDASLKRKLKFTPDAVKTGVKMRTPLSSRCNFQDSPSHYLKIMQVQKVDEELGYVCENVSNNYGVATNSIKSGHPKVEWDNKDATLIM